MVISCLQLVTRSGLTILRRPPIFFFFFNGFSVEFTRVFLCHNIWCSFVFSWFHLRKVWPCVFSGVTGGRCYKWNSCALLQSLLISPSVFVKWLGDSTAASPTRFSKIREIVSFCVCVLNQVKTKKTLGREILESIAGRSVKWRLICVRVISVFDVSHYEEESLE